MTENATKRPPSYYRYKKEHPTVSFVLNRELKEALDMLKGNRSYGQTMKQIIEDNVNQEMANRLREMQDEVSKLNRQLEYKRKIQRFEIPCPECEQPIHFSSDTDQWYRDVYPKLKQAFITWSHRRCPEER